MKKLHYLVKKVEYTVGVVIFMLISLIGLFLAILSWGVAVFSIVDILFINAPESFLIYKAWGCVSIVFIILSHPLFYLVMYTNVYDRIIAWIKSCSTNGLVIFTFGYINTYFLDLYYLRNRFSKSYLLSHGDILMSLAMFPILNIICYIDMIRSLRKCVTLPSNRELIKLYLKGQLMTYVIREYNEVEI